MISRSASLVLLFGLLAVSYSSAAAQMASAPQTRAEWQERVQYLIGKRAQQAIRTGEYDGIVGHFSVRVRMTITWNGTVYGIHVLESSGNPDVDRIAEILPILGSPFPNFPLEMRERSTPLIAPLTIDFKSPYGDASAISTPNADTP